MKLRVLGVLAVQTVAEDFLVTSHVGVGDLRWISYGSPEGLRYVYKADERAAD